MVEKVNSRYDDDMSNHSDYQLGEHAQFQSTQWSVVLAAKRNDSPELRKEALAQLCQAYWYPLFAYIRRQGYSFAETQDLTQGFLLSLLQCDFLQNVERERGRFRSFLLACCKKYVAGEYRHQQAQKRGGGLSILSLDYESAEQRFQSEPVTDATAEQLYEYQWAIELIQRVLLKLREIFYNDGKGDWFEKLKGYLDGSESISYKETAQLLGSTEGAVKVAVHRLRQQFAKHFREEIANTVENQCEVDEEIRAVFQALQIH